MNDAISKSMIESLRSQMPAIQAEELINTLTAFGNLKSKYETLDKEYTKSLSLIKELESDRSELKDKINSLNIKISSIKVREQDVARREDEATNREKIFDKELLNVKLESQVMLNKNLFDMMKIAFQSPLYQTLIEGSITTRDRYNNTVQSPYTQNMIQKQVDCTDEMHTHIDSNNRQTGPNMNAY